MKGLKLLKRPSSMTKMSTLDLCYIFWANISETVNAMTNVSIKHL